MLRGFLVTFPSFITILEDVNVFQSPSPPPPSDDDKSRKSVTCSCEWHKKCFAAVFRYRTNPSSDSSTARSLAPSNTEVTTFPVAHSFGGDIVTMADKLGKGDIIAFLSFVRI
jgi:hypothetical protein